MKKIFQWSCFGFMSFMIACNEEKKQETVAVAEQAVSFSLDSVKAQIAASNAKYGAYFSTGDSTGFVNCYTSDACIMPSNMPKMCGAAALNGFFNGGVKMGIKNIKLTTEEVMGGKEAVAEIGKYEILDAAGKSLDNGKFIVIWKEENGKWKMHRDTWNSDVALPGAAH